MIKTRRYKCRVFLLYPAFMVIIFHYLFGIIWMKKGQRFVVRQLFQSSNHFISKINTL